MTTTHTAATPEAEDAFRALAEAAIRAGAAMAEKLTPQALARLLHAERSGARVFLEVGPLPAIAKVTLHLVEPEGARHVVGSFSLSKPSIN